MANGISKSLAIRECIEGAISTQFTCTAAQNHQNAIVICDELATNELKVKTLKYYKSLHQNIDLAGNPKFNKIVQKISVLDRVLIISPHPDDDVIGMGGTMDIMPNKANVKILYMTNGDAATSIQGSRMKEALSAIKILGYDHTHIIDGQMPFYDTQDREIS